MEALLLCGSHAAVISARQLLADRTNATRLRAALEMPSWSQIHARRPTELAARNTLEILAKVDGVEFAAHNCCVKDTLGRVSYVLASMQ